MTQWTCEKLDPGDNDAELQCVGKEAEPDSGAECRRCWSRHRRGGRGDSLSHISLILLISARITCFFHLPLSGLRAVLQRSWPTRKEERSRVEGEEGSLRPSLM